MRTREQLKAIRDRRRSKRTVWREENGMQVSPNVPPFESHKFKLRSNAGGLNFDLLYERPDGRVDLIYTVTGLPEAEDLCEDWIDGIFGEDDEEPVTHNNEYTDPTISIEELFDMLDQSRDRKRQRRGEPDEEINPPV